MKVHLFMSDFMFLFCLVWFVWGGGGEGGLSFFCLFVFVPVIAVN